MVFWVGSREESADQVTVILDRVVPNWEPPYCIHGRATCGAGCGHWVYLGNETLKIVRAGAMPMCRQCAAACLPSDIGPVGHIDDHRRADGPHE